MIDHDIIDGFEITREASDIVDAFYLESASNANFTIIEEEEKVKAELLTKEQYLKLPDFERVLALEDYVLSMLKEDYDRPVYRILVADVLSIMVDKYAEKLLDLSQTQLRNLFDSGANLENMDWNLWVEAGFEVF